VITNGALGVVTNPQLMQQIDVLNTAYAPTGWQFTIASTSLTDNASWYAASPGSAAEAQATGALRVGGVRDLNIYIAQLSGGLLGSSTFPWNYFDDPVLDGVWLGNGTLPGGAWAPWNLGKTAVKEVGHWMGLHGVWYHPPDPSQSDCTGFGDYVLDTPSQAQPNFECVPANSCTAEPGYTDLPDSIHNYMNYTDDACRTEFTPGQSTRMLEMMDLRPG
jgi:hypothetical protein